MWFCWLLAGDKAWATDTFNKQETVWFIVLAEKCVLQNCWPLPFHRQIKSMPLPFTPYYTLKYNYSWIWAKSGVSEEAWFADSRLSHRSCIDLSLILSVRWTGWWSFSPTLVGEIFGPEKLSRDHYSTKMVPGLKFLCNFGSVVEFGSVVLHW